MCFRPSSPWKPLEGCADQHLHFGQVAPQARLVTPVKVPLVPMAATKWVSRPPVCLMISGPVPSKCAFQLAGLLYWSG